MHESVDAGADLIELGMPFSDPMADGAVIQQACDAALANGVGLRDVLSMAGRFRERDQNTPVVLMGYLNPIEQFGFNEFVKSACGNGVDGLLIVDLPPEEKVNDHELDRIRLVSPTTSSDRMAKIVKSATGFVYYVALKGVTGAANLDPDILLERIKLLRRHTSLPVAVGFGISGPDDAARVAKSADAVVVGSALVRKIQQAGSLESAQSAVRECLQPLRTALDEAQAVY